MAFVKLAFALLALPLAAEERLAEFPVQGVRPFRSSERHPANPAFLRNFEEWTHKG